MRRVSGAFAAGHWMVGCSPIIGVVFEFNGLPVIPAEALRDAQISRAIKALQSWHLFGCHSREGA
ncbi:Protein of unknown function (plasmid) [Azospirillum lipoferum 4B]|uniref:Uncharacterized protein n=1 Tax=Azospirillum lipoferum (strain 4B) TaxID=862719 RepID=G7ZIH7_AZOL4|nr:Protein of unknown function [Azospirillum lipoferum 4B]